MSGSCKRATGCGCTKGLRHGEISREKQCGRCGEEVKRFVDGQHVLSFCVYVFVLSEECPIASGNGM